MWNQLLTALQKGDHKSIARAISLVENEVEGYDSFLQQLPLGITSVTGITGPPGAGKSTLVDSLISAWVGAGKKVAVLCVDPSSPFNLGALLGDRIRMSEWYTNTNVFIRSLATRGSLGGLHPHIIEITAVLQAAGFEEIIVETVGVGQSEIEIAGLADVTVVVVVPEAGDEIQTMKAGIMEIADVFVVNKSDRPGADAFVKNLRSMVMPSEQLANRIIPVIKTVAINNNGMTDLVDAIQEARTIATSNEKKDWLLTERAWTLIQKSRMSNINKKLLKQQISESRQKEDFNLFAFIHPYLTPTNQL